MKYNINLIGKRRESFFDKALYFFLNYLRYILVITQLVVIGVLFYRFRVDQNIIDLKESIDQKKEIIQVVKPILAESEKIYNKINTVKSVISNQNIFFDTVNYILSIFPESLFLDNLTIEEKKIKLEGLATDPKQLQLFYYKLKNEGKFSSVDLGDIRRTENGYSFSISLENFKN